MADLGFGYTEMQAQNLIRYLAKHKPQNKTSFKASHGFMANLFIQFPELAKRRASSFEYLRTSPLTSDRITRFFGVLAEASTICNTLSANAKEILYILVAYGPKMKLELT